MVSGSLTLQFVLYYYTVYPCYVVLWYLHLVGLKSGLCKHIFLY